MDLRGRHFLAELDFTADEWAYLLALAAQLKREKHDRAERQRMRGRNIALIFEKTSTRTRCAFEVAAHDQGAHCTYLSGSQMGHKESVADTARVLGGMFDGIQYRGFAQETVEQLARYAGVPVWNGLTDQWHPTQLLADQLTMTEFTGRSLAEISISYVGDARFNMGNSILVASALMGSDVRIIAPQAYQPDEPVVAEARRLAEASGAQITITDDPSAVAGSDFVYTDVWVSMGEPAEVWTERVEALTPYQVNADLLRQTNNPDVKVLHCLPAFHNLDTAVGREVYEATGMTALEITDDVFEAHADSIFAEAANRMHTIKAVMVATIGDVD